MVSGVRDTAAPASVAVLREAWSQLGERALSYSSVTNDLGLPSTKARRTIYSRLLDIRLRSLLKGDRLAEAGAAEEIIAAVAGQRERMELVVEWHDALKRTYYELFPRGERFLADAVEDLLVPAWEASAEGTAPTETTLRRAVLALQSSKGPFTVPNVDRVLDDAVQRDDLERILRQIWDERAEPEGVDGAARRRLHDALLSFGELLVSPGRDSAAEVVEGVQREWDALVPDERLARLVSVTGTGLSGREMLERPALDGRGGHEHTRALLEQSIRGRLYRIMQNGRQRGGRSFPAGLTAWDGLERGIHVSAAPLGLGSAAARAVIALGALAYSGMTGDAPRSIGLEGVRRSALVSYFTVAWSRREAVERERERSGSQAVRFEEVRGFVDDPYHYAMRRLWVRVARTDYTADPPVRVADVWHHLRMTLTSSEGEVHRRQANVAARTEPRREDLVLNGLRARTRGSRSVLTFGSTVDGHEAVMTFLASVVREGDVEPADDLPATDPRATWERWAQGAAARQCAVRERREGPFDESRRRAVEQEERERLSTFEQVCAELRARLGRLLVAAGRTGADGDEG